MNLGKFFKRREAFIPITDSFVNQPGVDYADGESDVTVLSMTLEQYKAKLEQSRRDGYCQAVEYCKGEEFKSFCSYNVAGWLEEKLK